MTTITIKKDTHLKQTEFENIEELYYIISEEILEQKMQNAKKKETFLDF